ncbi:glycosyltransferase family 4 protein [Pedobacter sp. GR22-10]|uniref:glycosyltransferase family 4 protein n=1 Tax=Pedobacter sp. GR22-10 TaxID=2994472 RepID=UPI002247943E|nr:glycosyltransferase [Pedobacter sp. GR22-10]MCX2431354.1 glycosyltransferase [Pedobacter sp. GR22-10]
MNILFILPEYYPHSGGGISTYYLHYIKALRNYCSSIHVMVGSGYTQDEITYTIEDGIQIEYLKPSIFDSYLKKFTKLSLFPEYQRNVAAAWAMWDQADQGKKYDLIECTDFGLGYIPWIINHHKPVVTRLHGSFGQIELKEPQLKQYLNGDLNRQTELNLLSQSDVLITHSEANQQFWKEMINKDVTMLYPVFIPPIIEFSYNEEKLDFAIVCARIQQWKGPDILCKAIQELGNNAPKVKWYGKDTAFSKTSSKSEELKNEYPTVWGSKITWHSALPNNQVLAEQKKAKFAIVPSTWDMFNFTCLEYMSAGIPVICSDGAGVSELIENGVNGFNYPKNDFSSLAKNINYANALPEHERENIADSAMVTIRTLLSPEKIIPQNLDLYHHGINNFKDKSSNDYLNAIYKPSDTPFDIGDFLDVQPLRPLLQYIFKRIKKKISL